MERKIISAKISGLLKKYRFVILILLIGLAFMLIPTKENVERETNMEQVSTVQKEELDERLERILTHIEGVGQVRVLLTQDTGEKTIYQSDSDISEHESEKTTRITTITVTDAQRNQKGLVQQINPPTYLGAIVVCQGADSAKVKFAVIQAVSGVTGLGSDRISVLKMK